MEDKKMKVKGLRLFQLILLLAVSSICMTACMITAQWHLPVVWVDDNHHQQRPQHNYYYYPDVNVYYDPGPSIYFWFENDNWHHDRRLPSHIRVPKNHIRFRSDADKPYNVHDKVVERYRSDEKFKQSGEKRQKDTKQNKGRNK